MRLPSSCLLLIFSFLMLETEACGASRRKRSLRKRATTRRSAPDGKVAVDVFYETLCPDSKRFFLNQLLPTMKSRVGRSIDLRLVPYGHATTSVRNGRPSFRCQHGNLECQGNMVHACAIKRWERAAPGASQNQLVDYLGCMIRDNRRPLTDGKRCAEAHGVNWRVVRECVEEDGPHLLKSAGEATPSVSFIPHVTVNGETSRGTRTRTTFFPYSRRYVTSAYRNLKGAVCKTKAVDGC